jgi:hypothetical protein
MKCIGLGHMILLLIVWYFVSGFIGVGAGPGYTLVRSAIVVWWLAGFVFPCDGKWAN